MIHNRNDMDLTDGIHENPDYLEWAKIAADRDNLERAAVYAAIVQTQIAERQAAAQEKEEAWVYNYYLKLDALVGEVKRIAAVLERADNLSKIFEEG